MSKVSLTMIVGNVSEYIERCLRNFAPHCDEVVLVRAIGCATPDDTESIARRVLAELGIPLVWGEYKNKPGHEDWKHVDDFAAARQMSFDLASNDWCFWCDSDDTLESGGELIRQHAREGLYATYVFPYKISGLGVSVPRERLINRTCGRWQYPVHECFKFDIEPIQGAQDDRVVILHSPRFDKSGSNERNLRILKSIPESEMHPGLLYHLHGELMGIGDKEGSIRTAQKAFEDPRLGRAEKYEMLMNLARMTDDAVMRETLLHEAYRADPSRREALGVLSSNALDYGKPELALTYARQMMATPPPLHKDWNNRQSFYGWLGEDLMMQALRMNGHREAVDVARRAALAKAGGCRISLLHATRGRPQQAVLCRKVWLDMADKPENIEHIFVFDEDDEESKPLRRFHHAEITPGGGCVAAWNTAAQMSIGDVMLQLSDDWVPCQGWDTLILNAIGDLKKPAVLAISDGHRKDKLLCMAICTRAYYWQDFFLFHPDFTGVYSDNWFTDVAYARGQVIEAKHIEFLHRHPIFTGEPMDKTHSEQNAPARYVQGQAVMERLRMGNDWSTIPGWFNFFDFYKLAADSLKDGDKAVEVGVWLGRSITYLAQRIKRAGKQVQIYAVDSFKGEEGQTAHVDTVAANGGSNLAEFTRNIERCGVRDMVGVIEDDSANGAKWFDDESLSFVFIDAAHDYESVRRDIAAWLPKMKPGAVLAGHDAQHAEVMKAVNELLPGAVPLVPIWIYRVPK